MTHAPRRLWIAVLFLALAGAARAQLPADQQRLQVAENLVLSGRCGDAAVILREITQEQPQNPSVLNALKNAFICLKEYDSALVYLNRLKSWAADPRLRFGYDLETAGLSLLKNDTRRAGELIDAALASVPNDPQIFGQASGIYMSRGFYAEAVKVLHDGRKKFDDPTLFSQELGQLYEVMRNYGDAAREYFSLLARDSTREVMVSGKMNQLVKMDADEGFDTGLKEALEELVKANPASPHAQRYFGEYLVVQGHFDEAFRRFQLLDSLQAGEGKGILYFARVARNNDGGAIAEKACRHLISRYPLSALKTQARFLLAETLADARRYVEAAEIYDSIAAEAPSERDLSEATFDAASVRFHGLHDPAGALLLLDRLKARAFKLIGPAILTLIAADCQLALGKIDLADSLYRSINLTQLPPRNQEELLFKQAELQFYRGNFEAAREEYGKMMNTYPKSIYVNDCLRRIMLISDHSGMDEATLRIFSEALYATLRFNFDSALALYDRLRDFTGTSLVEIARFNSASLRADVGQTSQAIADLDSLLAGFPDSFYAPLALEKLGDIYADSMRDCAQAKAKYQSVLLSYPRSLNAEDVRRKLQRTDRIVCNPPAKLKS